MNKAKVILAMFVLTTALSSCFMRKKDRCPQVGQANYGLVEKK